MKQITTSTRDDTITPGLAEAAGCASGDCDDEAKPADELFVPQKFNFRMQPPPVEHLSFLSYKETQDLHFDPEQPQGDNYGVGNLIGVHCAAEFFAWCRYQGSLGTHGNVSQVIETVLDVLGTNNVKDPRRGAAVGFRDVLVNVLIAAAKTIDVDGIVAADLARTKKFYNNEAWRP